MEFLKGLEVLQGSGAHGVEKMSKKITPTIFPEFRAAFGLRSYREVCKGCVKLPHGGAAQVNFDFAQNGLVSSAT